MNQTFKSLIRLKIPVEFFGDVLLKFVSLNFNSRILIFFSLLNNDLPQFDREGGEKLKNAVIHFCRYQQYALDQIEDYRNQNQLFDNFLSVSFFRLNLKAILSLLDLF